METEKSLNIQFFLDEQNKKLKDTERFLIDQKKKRIELAIANIQAEFAEKVKVARQQVKDACCEQVLQFVRQRRRRFEECLQLLHNNKNKDLELELLEIGKEVGDLFGRAGLYVGGFQYEFSDMSSLGKRGLGPELRSFQVLIKDTWEDRLKRRERMFGKGGFHAYQPWFVFLSENRHSHIIT